MRVIIVGGGIAGLATAYALVHPAPSSAPGQAAGEARIEVTLLEAGERAGGKLQTERVDGYLIEGGPDAFLVAKPEAIALCHEVGLGDQLIPIQPQNRVVYIWSAGRLHRLPAGWRLMAPTAWSPFLRSSLFSWRAKLRMALDLVIPPRRSADDESVGSFMARRLGREAVAKVGAPLLGGIYGAGLETLSLKATFPQFAALEQTHGSVIRGLMAAAPPTPAPSPFLTLAGGTQALADALVQALGEVVRTGCPVARVAQISPSPPASTPPPPGPDGSGSAGYIVHLQDGSLIEADAVVLATPPSVSAALIQGCWPEVAASLRAFRTVSSAAVSLGFRREDVPHPLDGSGFMVASGETLTLRGCTWASSKFAGRAPAGDVLLRAFVGGEGAEATVRLADDEIVDRVRDDLRAVLGITAPPALVRLTRWVNANPLYDVGHLDRVAAVEGAMPPGLHLAGSAYRGVGVPDCVRQGRAVAARITSARRQALAAGPSP